MSDNYYQPPEAPVEDQRISSRSAGFYVVSPRKFMLLFLFTQGLYAVYWFYQQWAVIKRQGRPGIWPVPRAIFSIFFTHSLFREIDRSLEAAGRGYSWNGRGTATIYVVAVLVSYVFGRLAYWQIGSPLTDLTELLLLPVIMFPLLAAQKAVNVIQGDTAGDSNNTLTAANVIWMGVGTLLWLLTLLYFYVAVIGEEAFIELLTEIL